MHPTPPSDATLQGHDDSARVETVPGGERRPAHTVGHKYVNTLVGAGGAGGRVRPRDCRRCSGSGRSRRQRTVRSWSPPRGRPAARTSRSRGPRRPSSTRHIHSDTNNSTRFSPIRERNGFCVPDGRGDRCSVRVRVDRTRLRPVAAPADELRKPADATPGVLSSGRACRSSPSSRAPRRSGPSPL